MSMFDEGMDLLNEGLALAAGVEGTYTRAASRGGGSVELSTFIAGNSDHVSQPAPGEPRLRHDFQTRTLIGPTASLVSEVTGAAFEPAEDDVWVETINGTEMTFKVKPQDGQPAVTYSDPSKLRVRIRLKRVT